jgi:hypothetical protein
MGTTMAFPARSNGANNQSHKTRVHGSEPGLSLTQIKKHPSMAGRLRIELAGGLHLFAQT